MPHYTLLFYLKGCFKMKIKHDNDSMYEKFVDFCNRRGVRVYTKKEEFVGMRDGHGMLNIAPHPLITDCEPFMFILGEELPNRRDIDDPEGFDILVIPYKGYYDRHVQYAIDNNAYIMPLEEYIEFESDFQYSTEEGKTISIRSYLDDLNWGKFVMYDKNAIYNFRDEYFFLSNFYPCDITIDGITYKSSEAAFQAQKCVNNEERKKFAKMTPGQAKKYGKQVDLRPDWEDVKVDIMRRIVSEKFKQNPMLLEQLIATGDRAIVECNAWRDTFWGVSHGKGKNHLGKILMEVRGNAIS